ncbi:PPOX class F420-dependent oxidoreductase [Microbacterium sp.]|uniref:PPOX class F420-dependent oxidoreductase n=1 Tax=Microbacterium sp. TaxID=51671 RepID=UPI003F72ABF4
MGNADAWSQIATSEFVSLGTFRRSGEVVATPVWMAADSDELVVTTERSTGKVKRLRRNPAVTMQPCSRMGKIEPGAVTVTAQARVVEVDERANAVLAAKYGFTFRAFLAVERFVRRLQRRPGDRVILRISAE